MSTPLPAPLFSLCVYQEGSQVKSFYTFRDPACAIHRAAVAELLRRALAALECPCPPRNSPKRH